MTADFSVYEKGAAFERELRRLLPGQRMRVPARFFQDIMVPANSLDRQTPRYLAEWFRVRMPFACEVRQDALTGDFDYDRQS